MGDGIRKKYALIVNGDTEPRHLGNVERAVKVLRGEGGYDISVAGTQDPAAGSDHFAKADEEGLDQLLAGMKAKMDDDDLLVVYVTGHGGQSGDSEGCVQLTGSCVSLSSLAKQMKALSFGNRILVMDACYSGSGFGQFTDAKTTVVSQGSPGETVSCQNFSPFFWGDQVPDADQDGKISIQERFEFAVDKGKNSSVLQYYSPEPLSLSGPLTARPFKTKDGKPVEVNNGALLAAQLKRLKPGQIALVDFGADWCVPCKSYQPVFEKIAQQDGGKILMIHAEGKEGSEEDWAKYGIKKFPAVAFIDWNGKIFEVANPMDPMASLGLAALNRSEDQAKFLVAKLASNDAEERLNAVHGLAAMGPKAATAVPALTKAIAHPDAKLRLAAIEALGQIGEGAAPAVPTLIPLLKREDFDTVWATVKALAAIGPKAKAAIPDLAKLFGNDLDKLANRDLQNRGLNPKLQENQAFDMTFALTQAIGAALVRIAPRDPDVQKLFVDNLKDPNANYHRLHAAIVGLGALGGSAAETVPLLIPFLRGKHNTQAENTVVAIAKASPATVTYLVEQASDKKNDPFRRFLLLRCLRSLGPDAVATIPALKKIVADPEEDLRLRKWTAMVLTKIDPAMEAEMKPFTDAWANVSLQFNEPEIPAADAPKQDSSYLGWFWEAGMQFNARKDAVGGGFGLGAQYKFTDRFGLGLDLTFSGMSVDEGKKSVPDFQWGAGLEPTYQVVGKPGKVTGSLILGELGLYHLVGHKTVDGYLAPIGLRLNIPLFGTSALSLSGKPQVHFDGEFKGGAAAALAWKGEF